MGERVPGGGDRHHGIRLSGHRFVRTSVSEQREMHVRVDEARDRDAGMEGNQLRARASTRSGCL